MRFLHISYSVYGNFVTIIFVTNCKKYIWLLHLLLLYILFKLIEEKKWIAHDKTVL